MNIRAEIYLGVVMFLLLSCNSNPNSENFNRFITFAEAIERSFNQGNAQVVRQAFDYVSLASFVCKQMEVYDKVVIQATAVKIKKTSQITESLIRTTRITNAETQFINEYIENGFQHLVFKIYSPIGHLNYLDFKVYIRKRDGKIKILDIYNFVEGESTSSKISTFLNYSQQFNNGSNFQEDNPENAFSIALGKLKEVMNLSQIGDFEGALDRFEDISIQFKNRDVFLRQKISILTHLDQGNELREAINEYVESYPSDTRYIYFIRLLTAEDERSFNYYFDKLSRYIQERKFTSI